MKSSSRRRGTHDLTVARAPSLRTVWSARPTSRQFIASIASGVLLTAGPAWAFEPSASSGAPAWPNTVEELISLGAIGALASPITWVEEPHHGEDIWVPDETEDTCTLPWPEFFADSEQNLPVDGGGGDGSYTQGQQSALYTYWSTACGGFKEPFDPWALPPSDDPVPRPDQTQPLCTGFSCEWESPTGQGIDPVSNNDPLLCMGVGCGWPDPLPAPGDGRPDPADLCMGLDCPGVAPVPSPPQSGPAPSDLCMGLDCGGGGSEGPQECPPGDPDPGPPLMMGGVDTMFSPYPVDYAYGHKHETVVDLTVALSGQDFVLSRSYTSKPDAHGSGGLAGLFGEHWQLNVFQYVTGVGTSTLTVATPSSGTRTFELNTGNDRYEPFGPSSQYIEESTFAGHDTLKLVEPGMWAVHYFDTGDATLDGLIAGIESVYTDLFHVYEYVDINENSGGNEVKRLDKIHLNAELVSNVVVDAAAEVRFEWHLGGSGPSNMVGKLTSVSVFRDVTATNPPETQRVEYTYLNDFEDDPMNLETTPEFTSPIAPSAQVGTDGDLIQVANYTPVDRVGGVDGAGWHIAVTQYRYHGGVTSDTGTGDTDGDGFTEIGGDHQLKAILMPEQIEFATQECGSGGASEYKVLDFAEGLLADADDDPLCTGIDGAYDLASKIISEYETSSDGRVLYQYLTASCGCGGGAVQGLRLDYDYTEFTGATSGDYGRTTKITYNENTGSGATPTWTAYIEYSYDMTKFDQTGGPTVYRLSNVYVNGLTTGMEWVTHATYTAEPYALASMASPEAVASYTAANGASNPPSLTLNTLTGLIAEYKYTTGDFRLRETAVKEGDSGTAQILSKVTYGAAINSTDRPWLPKKIERYRTGAGATSEEIETVEFSYSFYDLDGDSGTDEHAIAYITTTYEAGLESENGPGGNYVAVSSFDLSGRNHWTRQADNVLVVRTFSDDTGALTSSKGNADGLAASGGPDFEDSLVGMPAKPALTPPADYDGRGDDDDSGTEDDGSLTVTYTYDLSGRIRTYTGVNGATVTFVRELLEFDAGTADDRPGVYCYALTTLPFEFGGSFSGAASVGLFNAAGDRIATRDFELAGETGTSGYGGVVTGYNYKLSTEVARQSSVLTITGLVASQYVWHDVSGGGESGGFYKTDFTYDGLGRLSEILEPNDNITQLTYDVRGRVIKVFAGVDGGSSPTLMTEYFYDSDSASQGAGNGNLGFIRQHVGGSSSARDTILRYDYRNRVFQIENPEAPHAMFVYDNQDRVIESALFATLPSGVHLYNIDSFPTLSGRGMYMETAYSQRGMPYRQRVSTAPTSNGSSFLETHTWYDQIGRVVGAWAPNATGTKITYNALGQIETVYVTDRGGDVAPGATGNLASVFDESDFEAVLTGDVVFDETSFMYREAGETPAGYAGLLYLTTSRSRVHDASDAKTGSFESLAGSDPELFITTYAGAEYDLAGRVTKIVNFGTNKDADFSYGGPEPTLTTSGVPAWNAASGVDVIEVEIFYDDRGRIEIMKDPLERETKIVYDDLGRQIATIENAQKVGMTEVYQVSLSWDGANNIWTVADASAGVADDDRVVSTAYVVTQNVTKVTAHDLSSGTDAPQTTEYRAAVSDGVTAEDNLPINGAVRRIVYPDTAGSLDEHSVRYAYNLQGEVRYVIDQNDVSHTYTRDDVGRVTADVASIPGGSDIDDWVDKIETQYDSFGRVKIVESLKGVLVVNAVQMSYTALWQPARVYQQHDDAVNVSTSPYVEYSYDTDNAATANGNFSRLETMRYPDGTLMEVLYRPSAGGSITPGYRASRVHGIAFDSADEVEYAYLGFAAPVITDYVVPDVQLDMSVRDDGVRATGTYEGLDQFGRLTRQRWVDGDFTTGTGSFPNIPEIVAIGFTYDDASNLTSKWDARAQASQSLNWEYGYDALDRLVLAEKGSGNAGGFTIDVGSEEWELDTIGNWEEYWRDLNGDNSSGSANFTLGDDHKYELDFSEANEITTLLQTIAGTQSPSGGETFTYDEGGHLEEDPQQTSISRKYLHDAWGRLVKVDTQSGSTLPRAVYEYNGLNWRTVKRSDSDITDLSNTIDQSTRFFYSLGWQVIQEDIDDSWTSGHTTDRVVQRLWGVRYIDDLVLQREDENGDGDYVDAGDSEFYALTDHQFSVVARINASAELIERVSYTPYGVARHHYGKDVDGDGDVDSADAAIVSAAAALTSGIPDGNYNPDADFDRDGDVDSADTANIGSRSYESALPAGAVSSIGATISFCGYVWNAESGEQGVYTVRFRHCDPLLGRWLERDPAGYRDSMSLYAYGWGSPILHADPMGLSASFVNPAAKIEAVISALTFQGLTTAQMAVRLLELGFAVGVIAAALDVSHEYVQSIQGSALIAASAGGAAESSAEEIDWDEEDIESFPWEAPLDELELLTEDEIEALAELLEALGQTLHGLKQRPASRRELYRDKEGRVYEGRHRDYRSPDDVGECTGHRVVR